MLHREFDDAVVSGDASELDLGVGRMSLSARKTSRRDPSNRASRTGPVSSFLGGAALALVGLAGGWTGYVHLIGKSAETISFNERLDAAGTDLAAIEEAAFAAASFADRFAVVTPDRSSVAAAAPVAPKKKNVYVALLDPTYSLGSAPDSFTIRTPKPTIAEANKVDTLRAEEALLTRTPAQLALNVPMPSSRPSDLRVPQAEVRAPLSKNAFSHDALVQRARMALATAKPSNASIFEKLFGNPAPAPTVLAYAGSDGGVLSNGSDSAAAKPGLYDRTTAVYDISKRMVYLPDGTKLEAHSGLGQHLDKADFAHLRMRGVTPPHIYDLKPRETLFHGVAALRLTPVGGEGAIYGRTGLLAHTYMLGPNGDSNGCVSFKDYNKFLQAYRNGDVKRLIVVAKMD
ncbi:MAG: hypothetical protein JWP21_592 [Tardiphaga sp.]|jgi:hypothetical protein|nr:hypothetical protein [Tardiphaga sp.]